MVINHIRYVLGWSYGPGGRPKNAPKMPRLWAHGHLPQRLIVHLTASVLGGALIWDEEIGKILIWVIYKWTVHSMCIYIYNNNKYIYIYSYTALTLLRIETSEFMCAYVYIYIHMYNVNMSNIYLKCFWYWRLFLWSRYEASLLGTLTPSVLRNNNYVTTINMSPIYHPLSCQHNLKTSICICWKFPRWVRLQH